MTSFTETNHLQNGENTNVDSNYNQGNTETLCWTAESKLGNTFIEKAQRKFLLFTFVKCDKHQRNASNFVQCEWALNLELTGSRKGNCVFSHKLQ